MTIRAPGLPWVALGYGPVARRSAGCNAGSRSPHSEFDIRHSSFDIPLPGSRRPAASPHGRIPRGTSPAHRHRAARWPSALPCGTRGTAARPGMGCCSRDGAARSPGCRSPRTGRPRRAGRASKGPGKPCGRWRGRDGARRSDGVAPGLARVRARASDAARDGGVGAGASAPAHVQGPRPCVRGHGRGTSGRARRSTAACTRLGTPCTARGAGRCGSRGRTPSSASDVRTSCRPW